MLALPASLRPPTSSNLRQRSPRSEEFRIWARVPHSNPSLNALCNHFSHEQQKQWLLPTITIRCALVSVHYISIQTSWCVQCAGKERGSTSVPPCLADASCIPLSIKFIDPVALKNLIESIWLCQSAPASGLLGIPEGPELEGQNFGQKAEIRSKAA